MDSNNTCASGLSSPKITLGEGLSDDRRDIFALEGFRHDEIDAFGPSLRRVNPIAESGHAGHRHGGISELDETRHLPARQPGHGEVGNDQIKWLFLNTGKARFAVGTDGHGMALTGQQIAQHVPDLLFVVDDQDLRVAVRLGDRRWLQNLWGLLCHGQADGNRGALPYLTLNFDLSTMTADKDRKSTRLN